MNEQVSRRRLLLGASGLAVASGAFGGMPPAAAHADTRPWPGFPRQDAKLVAEVVGQAHRNEAKVRELVKARPALVNAWWDWGFGDWESALGAASHVGQRGIAEFLLEHGARMDIFAAAMLGMTEVVKAFVTAQPGVQRTLGPHGIPLLAHAKAGGTRAAQTVAYLESLGDAGTGLKVLPLTAERKSVYLGQYETAGGDVRLDVQLNKTGQTVLEIRFEKEEMTSRWIHYAGEDEFFPPGVPSVRIRFEVREGKAQAVTIRENEPILTAKRRGD